MLKKAWKDPVWSKVIATIPIAVGTIVYNYIKSKTLNISFKKSFIEFWTTDIELWIAALALFLSLSLIWLIRQYGKNKKKKFLYDEKSLQLDIALFNRIRNELLPQDGTIYWLRYNNFAGFSFLNEKIDQLSEIEYEAKKSDFEFLNPELEEIKEDMIYEIETFTDLIAGNTFQTTNGRQTVPPEWETEQTDRFNEVVNDIHNVKHRICDKYDKLIKVGRRTLKV